MIDFILENPDYTLFDNFIGIKYREKYKSCKIVDIPVKYFPRQFAFTIQKNSEYFDAFNHHLLKMKERGSFQQIIEKYRVSQQQCPETSGQPTRIQSMFYSFLSLDLWTHSRSIIIDVSKTDKNKSENNWLCKFIAGLRKL